MRTPPTYTELLREKLATIRVEAMEIATAIEFTGTLQPEEHPVHQWAVRTIKEAEEIIKNTRGELDPPSDSAVSV